MTPIEISLIIPFLNEKENVSFLVNELSSFFTKNSLSNVEVIFVDDGSTDGSGKLLIDELSRKTFPSKVIKLSKNYGAHPAIRAGLVHATGEYALFLAADLQDSLQLILDLYSKAKEGFDIVFAFRENVSNSTFENYFSQFFAKLMQKFVTKNYPDKGFDITFFNRKVINAINANIESNSSLMLQLLTLGFSQTFVPYTKVARKVGKSKWTISKKIKLLIDSFVAFSYVPIRFVSLVGVLFFIFGVSWTIYIITQKLFYNNLVTGWASLTSILLLGFGITNISLGIIAEYLWRTLDASRKRPVFIIDSISTINHVK